MMKKGFGASVALVWALALVPSEAATQTIEIVSGEAVIGPILPGAPFSADAYTKVSQTLVDGTKINRSITARFYRDSVGRVRREQTIIGLEPLSPSGESQLSVTIVDPVADVTYVLSPTTHTAIRRPIERRGPTVLLPDRRSGFPGSATAYGLVSQPAARIGPFREAVSLMGARLIEGLESSGTMTVTTYEAGSLGNDRPIQLTDVRWESKELGVVVQSRHHDPWTGDVEYGLTNIRRGEPAANLFVVPANYTIVEVPQ